MSNDMPAPDLNAELENLFRQAANPNMQVEADVVLKYRKEDIHDGRFTSTPNTVLRATSPHVLSINNYFDRNIQLESFDYDMTHVQLVPTSRERSCFGFNTGLDILSSALESGKPLPDDLAQRVLDRLEVGQIYYDHGDFPGWLGLARVDEAGTMLANIDNEDVRYGGENKISALFKERAEDGVSVAPAAMTGLWALALALKIQQKAREDGSVYELLSKGIRVAEKPLSVEGLPGMLLQLDR